jgi:ribosomal protein S18 acetylase RimI-like enzyme
VNVRDLRPSDAQDLLRFLRNDFPEEEALLGTRPEGFERIVRRVFRLDLRIVLGFLRLIGRPVYRFFVFEDQGRLVATTLLSFTESAGWVSMVVVDPAYRRRGLARELLGRAEKATRARGKPHIALDVLAANVPARALYERLGYRLLRSTAYYVLDNPASVGTAPAAPVGLRPFQPRDAPALAELARRGQPPEVARVIPTTARQLAGSPWEGEIFASEIAAWVIEDASGPKAWVSAVVSAATEAGHLSNPIVDPSVPADRADGLIRTAVAWCGARAVPRIMTMVPEENGAGRAALERTGFRNVIPVCTLYRPVD